MVSMYVLRTPLLPIIDFSKATACLFLFLLQVSLCLCIRPEHVSLHIKWVLGIFYSMGISDILSFYKL